MFKLSNKSKKNREGVDPMLIAVSNRAIQITKVDFGIPSTGGVRSDEFQNELFVDGKSKVDGYDNRSKHQKAKDGYGKALDVFAYVNGHANWEIKNLAQIACAFFQAASELNVRIKWGGLFKSYVDGPHFELVDYE